MIPKFRAAKMRSKDGVEVILSDYCIYTIKHTDDLRKALATEGGCGKFKERRRWVQADRLLKEAQEQEKRLPIIFAPAENTSRLFGWALLEKISVDDHDTEYEFSAFREFRPTRPLKSSLRKMCNGEPLAEQFIRPYAICETPASLRNR